MRSSNLLFNLLKELYFTGNFQWPWFCEELHTFEAIRKISAILSKRRITATLDLIERLTCSVEVTSSC